MRTVSDLPSTFQSSEVHDLETFYVGKAAPSSRDDILFQRSIGQSDDPPDERVRRDRCPPKTRRAANVYIIRFREDVHITQEMFLLITS